MLVGCTGVSADRGLTEPMRVARATFEAGDLPGEPPPAPDAPPDAPKVDPRVTLIESVNNVLAPGEAEKSLSGRASESAVAVGIRFGDLGTGYWVVPAGGLEPSVPGERTWSLKLEVDEEAPAGLHTLRLAAIDDAGKAGTQAELPVCVTSKVPDNLNACDPTIEPPAAVLSLAWDSAADLDLGVVTPSGKLVDPKHPTTAEGEPPAPDPQKDGVFDRDAGAACAGDLGRREDLVWQGEPAPGTYLVHVNMFEPCAQAAARFVVTLHRREAHDDGTFALVEAQRVSGEVLGSQANGGAAPGLYVMAVSFE
jgi:hypothetical protein